MDNKDMYFSESVKWENTGHYLYLYKATVNDQYWLIRINDFPDEMLYTLLIDNKIIADFDDWPLQWERPNRSPI